MATRLRLVHAARTAADVDEYQRRGEVACQADGRIGGPRGGARAVDRDDDWRLARLEPRRPTSVGAGARNRWRSPETGTGSYRGRHHEAPPPEPGRICGEPGAGFFVRFA